MFFLPNSRFPDPKSFWSCWHTNREEKADLQQQTDLLTLQEVAELRIFRALVWKSLSISDWEMHTDSEIPGSQYTVLLKLACKSERPIALRNIEF